MLGKRKPSASLISMKKRRKSTPSIEEISFDFSAREDYLTGFHKRKLQRIKHAKLEAAKKERQERIAARKILRENRKADLEKRVDAVTALVKTAVEEEDVGSEAEDSPNGDRWDGIEEMRIMDNEEEFMDEDRFTTVTVEAVDVSKDGLHKVVQEDENREDESKTSVVDTVVPNAGRDGKRIWTKERPGGPKKKKKKFRYESKADRKMTRHKERLGNKLKAKARKQ